MKRREFLAIPAAAAAVASPQRPNIVFLMLDDLGAGDLGCYGQKLIQTPNIDRAAKEGMRFTAAYAGAAVCAPSRAVLMTGLHGGHAPVRANAGTIPLAEHDVTIAEVLKRAGYVTGGFGKWGLGDAGSTGAPERHGFDEFFGYLHQVHAHSYYTDFLWDNGRKHSLHGEYSADVIANRTLDFVRRNRSHPFFLYATWTLPHGKFETPDVKPYEGRDWPEGAKTYAAMVTRADRHAGRLFELLKELGIDGNTVVFVTSDNGAHSGDGKGFDLFRSNGSLRGEKGQVYEGGIRVPMIVRWPGHVQPGATSDRPTAFCDVLPTLAEIAGTKAARSLDGVSFVKEVRGGRAPRHEFLYWEHNTYDQKSARLREDRLLQAVRMGEWKGVRQAPGKPLELYNLRTDPSEQTDVARANEKIVNRIEQYLAGARTPPRPHNTGSMQWVR